MKSGRRSTPQSCLALVFLAAVALAGCGQHVDPVDLVLRNGTVVTMDSTRPAAQAIAISADTIVAVGADSAIQRYIGPKTRVIDLAGHLAIPGFNESHGHFTGLGEALTELDLLGVPSWQQIAAMVSEAAKSAKPGAWIRGAGWHQEKWNTSPGRVVEGFQTNDLINQAAPDNPVVLDHASGHALIANDVALKLAGIGPSTPNPPGGRIIKDARGRPTGVLVDGAQSLIGAALAKSLAARTPEEARADFVRQVAPRDPERARQRRHHLPGHGRVVCHHRCHQEDGGRRRHAAAALHPGGRRRGPSR